MKSVNPFFVGIPVDSRKFLGRQKELFLIKNRVSQGQSVAVIGESLMGKTSILRYFSDAKSHNIFGRKSGWTLIQFLDSQCFSESLTQADIWEMVFSPIANIVIPTQNYSEIERAYLVCKNSGFTTFNIERLLVQMELTDWQIIVLFDEFDNLLYHPMSSKAEFFGALRSLASRFGKVFTIIIASREHLSGLNQQTQQFSRTGSPYFNFILEITLGAFNEKLSRELLSIAENRFSSRDIEFILDIAGGYPYFLQAAGFTMWEAYDEFESELQRLELTSKKLLEMAEKVLAQLWLSWTPETKKAFSIVALDEIPTLVGNKSFDLNTLLITLEDYAPELRQLERKGFIHRDTQLESGWSVNGKVMLWWLADELIKALRENEDLNNWDWLKTQRWDGMLKVGEKEQIVRVAKEMASVLKNSATILINAAVEKASKSL